MKKYTRILFPPTKNQEMLRTKVCRHQSERGFCAMNSQGKCTFAHTMEELSPIVCFYNENCINERCNRFHPGLGEPMSYYMQKNNMSFPSPSPSLPVTRPVSPSSAVTKCTKPCYHAVCLMRSECTFAHSLEELNPIPCVYNERCVNERCNRFHPAKGETVQQYANKNNFVFPSPVEQKIEEEKRIIIHFDPEEYEIVYEDVYEDEEDILEILRREDGGENDDENDSSSTSSSPSLEDMIQNVPDDMAAMIPRSVYLLPYDKACDVMSDFLQEMELTNMTNMIQICA